MPLWITKNYGKGDMKQWKESHNLHSNGSQKPLHNLRITNQWVRKHTRYQFNHKIISWWIPQHLLRAQGYYEGNTWIWVPKRKNKPITMSMTSTSMGQPLLPLDLNKVDKQSWQRGENHNQIFLTNALIDIDL